MMIRNDLIDGERGVVYSFDNLSELVVWADANKRKNGYSQGDYESFFGDKGFDEAVRDALNGNVQRTDCFSGVLDSVKSLIHTEKMSMTHDVTGEILDIGAFLSGEPECFLRRLPRPDKPVVRIVADMAFSCHQNAACINRRGAAIVSLVDELQEMGYCVEVSVMSRFGFRKAQRLEVECGVRCDPVDVDAFATMCSSSYLRRFLLAIIEKYYGADWPEHSHGHPVEVNKRSCCADFLFKGNANIYVSAEKTKEIVLKMLEMHETAEGCVSDIDAYYSR